MLQKEFEERIGRSVTQEEYVEANAMYMAAGDGMDKDTFCREWLKIGESALVKGLFSTAYNLNKALTEEHLQLKETKEIVSEAADAILEACAWLLDGEAAECSDHEEASLVRGGVMLKAAEGLNVKARWLVGQKEVTRRRVEKGYRLDAKDRELIINNLTK